MKIHSRMIPTRAEKAIKSILQYLKSMILVSCRIIQSKKNLLLAFQKVASTVLLYESMSRTYYKSHTTLVYIGSEPLQWCRARTHRYLSRGNFRLEYLNPKIENTCLWLIHIVRDEFLIPCILHEWPAPNLALAPHLPNLNLSAST